MPISTRFAPRNAAGEIVYGHIDLEHYEYSSSEHEGGALSGEDEIVHHPIPSSDPIITPVTSMNVVKTKIMQPMKKPKVTMKKPAAAMKKPKVMQPMKKPAVAMKKPKIMQPMKKPKVTMKKPASAMKKPKVMQPMKKPTVAMMFQMPAVTAQPSSGPSSLTPSQRSDSSETDISAFSSQTWKESSDLEAICEHLLISEPDAEHDVAADAA
jgi:hypothetical protein